MSNPLRIEGKRDVKLQTDVVRTLARRVEALAECHKLTRTAAVRAVLESYVPNNSKKRTPAMTAARAKEKPKPNCGRHDHQSR